MYIFLIMLSLLTGITGAAMQSASIVMMACAMIICLIMGRILHSLIGEMFTRRRVGKSFWGQPQPSSHIIDAPYRAPDFMKATNDDIITILHAYSRLRDIDAGREYQLDREFYSCGMCAGAHRKGEICPNIELYDQTKEQRK